MKDNSTTFDSLMVYNLFKEVQRQYAIEVLRSGELPMDLSTVATQVNEQFDGGYYTLDPDTPAEKQLAAEFHHIHLPKLAEADIIEYDPNEQVIESFDKGKLDELLEAGKQLLKTLEADDFYIRPFNNNF